MQRTQLNCLELQRQISSASREDPPPRAADEEEFGDVIARGDGIDGVLASGPNTQIDGGRSGRRAMPEPAVRQHQGER